MVSISACHAEDPGSIPGRGVSFFISLSQNVILFLGCCLSISPFLTHRSDFVYDLFDHMSIEEDGGGGGGAIVGRKPTALGKRGGKRKKATVSSQFKVRFCKYVRILI